MWSCRSIISLLLCCGCFSKSKNADDIMYGTISYPFSTTKPLGVNSTPDKFVIRSIVGQREYVVEIPGGGEDYDIEIPLSAIDTQTGFSGGDQPKDLPPPQVTDQELVGSFPKVEAAAPEYSKLADKAFGVGREQGSQQSPSYTMGLAKINDFFKKRQFEYALLEINSLLNYYPTSPQLHKMKGTLFVKMQSLDLAQKSWIKALELNPQDRILQQALLRLKGRIMESQGASVQEEPSLDVKESVPAEDKSIETDAR